MPYVCTILLNGADKALLLSSPDEEVMVPLLLMVQLKGDYEEEVVKAQAWSPGRNLYRRLAAGEQAGKIMEEVSGEVTGKNTDRNSGGEYSFILAGTLSPGHLSQIWEMMKKADTLQENKNAADATAGQVLTYQGELKLVPYHQISSGMTRDGAEVFHNEEYSYLKSVDSSQDKDAPDYVNSTYVSASQLPARLVIKKRDSAGYVTALTADGSWLEGESFRRECIWLRRIFPCKKWEMRCGFCARGKGHGLVFPSMGEMRWRRRAAAGRKFWRLIFRRWSFKI